MPENPSLEAFKQRIPQPKGMSNAAWEMVGADIRERAFFMATVSQAEVLDLFKTQQERLLAGHVNESEYRRALREGLNKLGYVAPVGKEGGIQDLKSVQRQNLVMDTNRRMAAGYANHLWALENRDIFPVKQMVRLTNRREPRDWTARWKAVAATTAAPAGTYNVARKMALVDSPIWAELSRFGVPYPVYDFNSGMGDREVDAAEAEAAGIKVPAPLPEGAKPSSPSFNEGFAMTPRVSRTDVNAELDKSLGGLARREGDKLVFVDPNGTTKVSPHDAAGVIAPKGHGDTPLSQRDALMAYMERGQGAVAPDTVDGEYFRRLVDRVEPSAKGPMGGPLVAGVKLGSKAERTAFLTRMAARTGGGWDGGPTIPYARRDVDKAVSEANRNGVVIVVKNYQNAKDLSPVTRNILGDHVSPQPDIFFDWFTFFVVTKILDRDDGPAIVEVEEMEGGGG